MPMKEPCPLQNIPPPCRHPQGSWPQMENNNLLEYLMKAFIHLKVLSLGRSKPLNVTLFQNIKLYVTWCAPPALAPFLLGGWTSYQIFKRGGAWQEGRSAFKKKKNPEYLMKKKPPTCEEGGGHLGISFWHLLMNFEKTPKKRILKK